MAVMPVPSRHLAGVGKAAKWTFGGLADASFDPFAGTDYSGSGYQVDSSGNYYDPSNPNNVFIPDASGGASSGGYSGGGFSTDPNSWLGVLSNAISTAGKVATVATAPPGTTFFPSGAFSTGGIGIPGLTSASMTSLLPLLLIGGGILVVAMLAGGKH